MRSDAEVFNLLMVLVTTLSFEILCVDKSMQVLWIQDSMSAESSVYIFMER